MKLWFTISEMCIDVKAIPQQIADAILTWHIIPMSIVREKLGLAIFCKDSKGNKSGYRPYRWEILRNRSGGSQHTFGQGKKGVIEEDHRGAADWRCKNFRENKSELLRLILEHTDYTRIVIYNHFIHCDYKARDGKRYVFTSTDVSEWTFVRYA